MAYWGSLAVFLGLVVAVAALGGQWGAQEWYRGLAKPAWTPPGWVFPIAWSILYLLIALAGWWVWQTPAETPGRTAALAAWGVQLVANAAWSYVFFALRQPPAAVWVLAVILLASIAFIWLTRDSAPGAALAFVPYVLWLSYAASVNIGVVVLNRQA